MRIPRYPRRLWEPLEGSVPFWSQTVRVGLLTHPQISPPRCFPGVQWRKKSSTSARLHSARRHDICRDSSLFSGRPGGEKTASKLTRDRIPIASPPIPPQIVASICDEAASVSAVSTVRPQSVQSPDPSHISILCPQEQWLTVSSDDHFFPAVFF